MIRLATPKDLTFIRHLQKRFSKQVGFIPDAATARELERGNVFTGELNEEEAGFLLVHPFLSSQPTTAAIIQAAVRMDAQRQRVGLDLVDQVANDAAARGCTVIQATCKEDIEAIHFWHAAGFTEVARRPGGKCYGKELVILRRPLTIDADLHNLPHPKYSRGPGGPFRKRPPHPSQLSLLLQT